MVRELTKEEKASIDEHFDDTHYTHDQLDAKRNRNYGLIGGLITGGIAAFCYYMGKDHDPGTQESMYMLPAILFGTTSLMCFIGAAVSHYEYKNGRNEN